VIKTLAQRSIEKGNHIKGIILLRLTDERSEQKIVVLEKLIKKYGHKLAGSFVVVTEKKVRFAYIKDTL